jgi:diamine N-acetyltransferase
MSTIEPATIRIRHATAADAQALTALAERTFRDAFARNNSDQDMESYIGAAFSLSRIRAELDADASTFLLVFAGGAEPIGYAKLRTDSSDASVQGAAPIELERIYVDQTVAGRGVGAALMQGCLDVAGKRGFRTLWLGVWEHNARAIAFYEKWGFRTVGTHDFRLGSSLQTDLIMERPIVRGSPTACSMLPPDRAPRE